MENEIFKTCPSCGMAWADWSLFLADPATSLIGYQAFWGDLLEGLFLFNHRCGTTMSISVGDLRHLYSGPVGQRRLAGTDACAGMCLHTMDIRPCPTDCECAYIREIMQIVRKWPKKRR
ncbi:MAG: hypothetical protein ACOY32_15820 [Thermodesulfobacteriota bacterium]